MLFMIIVLIALVAITVRIANDSTCAHDAVNEAIRKRRFRDEYYRKQLAEKEDEYAYLYLKP